MLVVVLSGGGDDKKADSTATQAANTTSTQAQPQVRAQVNLTPPKGAPVKKAVAIVQIVDVNGQQAINAVTQGLPTSNKKAAYGAVVLQQPVAGQAHRRLRPDRQQGPPRPPGRSCPKDVDIAGYKELLSRARPSGNPTTPGTIYLRGSIQSAAGG